MSVKGGKELERAFERMSRLEVAEEMLRAVNTVRDAAVLGCPVNHGELRHSIYGEVNQRGDVIQGVCFTNKDHAVYVEFGTGPKGEKNHANISPAHNPVYTQEPWWIHESKIDERDADKYGWFYIDTPDGRFYQCTGQPAHPFMYPALKNNEDRVLRDFDAQLSVNLEGLLKK